MRQIEGGRETGGLTKRDLETEEVELGGWEIGKLEGLETETRRLGA